jgi:hypothetical protein
MSENPIKIIDEVGIGFSEQVETDVTDVITGNSASLTSEEVDKALDSINKAHKLAGVLSALLKVSEDTGSYVQMPVKLKFLPVLIGQDNEVIPLYHFVEALDEAVDYDRIQNALPTLSYAQIHGAISFIRRLSQFNMAEIDIDQLEDEDTAQNESLLNELTKALADKEITRVLHHD